MSTMTKDQQVNAVALSMQRMMAFLDSQYSKLVGNGQHEIILLVGSGDVVQFSANTPRPRSILMLQDLLARWSLGMPDTLPGEQSPGDTRAFEYLLNTLEAAAHAPNPSEAGYPAARAEVLKFVGDLQAQVNRSKA